MKKNIFLIFLICSIFFFSCSTTKITGKGGLSPVYVTNTKPVNILEPGNMKKTVATYQLIEGKFGSNEFSLMAYVEVDPKGIFITLMNDMGTDMGTVSYDGETVVFESAYFPKNLKGEYIIADIQNAYYDFESLKENYNLCGLDFQQVINQDGSEVREVLNGKKLIEEIIIHDDSIIITNHLRGYEYILTDGGIVE